MPHTVDPKLDDLGSGFGIAEQQRIAPNQPSMEIGPMGDPVATHEHRPAYVTCRAARRISLRMLIRIHRLTQQLKMRNKTWHRTITLFENSKCAPPSRNIDGKNFDAAAPAHRERHARGAHCAEVAPTLINPVTCESSQIETARDGGGGQMGVAQSGARVVAHMVGSDTRGDD